MFQVTGQLIAQRPKKIETGKKAGSTFQVLQFKIGSEKYAQLIDVTDYDNTPYETGKVYTLPIWISIYETRSGAVGLNYKIAKLEA